MPAARPAPTPAPPLLTATLDLAALLRTSTARDLELIHCRIADLNLELALLSEVKRLLAQRLEFTTGLSSARSSGAFGPPTPPRGRRQTMNRVTAQLLQARIADKGPSTLQELSEHLASIGSPTSTQSIRCHASKNPGVFTWDGERVGLVAPAAGLKKVNGAGKVNGESNGKHFSSTKDSA